MVAIVVTDRRLVVQGLNRKFAADGPPLSLPPERIAEARFAEGLRIRTADGEKLKLEMMAAAGPLGGLGGGEYQREGVRALEAWVTAMP
jgi:hypothetical protein